MPKKLKLVNDFSGGLVDAMHSRDIPENSLSKAKNVNLAKDGSIRPMASPQDTIKLSDDFFFEMEGLDFRGGHTAFHFKSDFNLSQRVQILSIEDINTTTTDNIRVYTAFPHGFKTGIVVTFTGVDYRFQGQYTITNVNDMYSFDVFDADHASDHMLAHGDIDTDLAVNNTNSLADNKYDNIITLDGAASPHHLPGTIIKIDTEMMLVKHYTKEDRTQIKVMRAWPNGTSGLGSHSATDIYHMGHLVQTNSYTWMNDDGVSMGFAHYQEKVTNDNSKTDLFIFLNGPSISLTDGNIFLRNIGNLMNVSNSLEDGRFHHNDHHSHYSADVATDKRMQFYPPGSVSASFLKTNDGVLISALPNMQPTASGDDELIAPKLLKYLTPRKIGSYATLVTDIDDYADNSGDDTASNWDYGDINTNFAKIDATEFWAYSADDNIRRAMTNGISVDADEWITVTFDVGPNDQDSLYQNSINNCPIIYFSQTQNADSGSISRGTQCQSKPGFNSFTFKAKNADFTTNSTGSNFIRIQSGTQTIYLIFETYKKCNYRVQNLHVCKTIANSDHGWYVQSASKQPPAFDSQRNSSFGLTVDASNEVFLQVYEDATETGDWTFGAMDFEYLQFGVSTMYYDSETESDITLGGALGAFTGNAISIKGEIRYTNASASRRGWPPGAIGFKIYLVGAGQGAVKAIEDPFWFATVYFNPTRKSRLFDGTELSFSVTDTVDMAATFAKIDTIPANTYEDTTAGVKIEYVDKDFNNTLFGASCSVGGMAYIANIRQRDLNTGKSTIFGDKIVRCHDHANTPKPTFYPLIGTNILNVGLADDGNKVVEMLSMDDQVFIFKEDRVYVMQAEYPSEKIIATLNGVGIINKSAATKTIAGIAWVNESGCYTYDGENLNNLMKGQISKLKWSENFANFANIGFSQPDQTMICVGQYRTYIYSFTDEHWVESDAIHSINTFSLSYGMTNILSIEKGALWVIGANWQPETVGESITSQASTEGVMGQPAYAVGMLFELDDNNDGGNIHDGGSPENYKWFVKDSGDTTRQISTPYDSALDSAPWYDQLAATKTAIEGYSQALPGDLKVSVWGHGEGTTSMQLAMATTSFDTAWNSNGLNDLWIDTDGSNQPDTDYSTMDHYGDFNNTGVSNLQNAREATAPVRKIIFERNGNTSDGVVYVVITTVARQVRPSSSYSLASVGTQSFDNPLEFGIHWEVIAEYEFIYETSYGDTNDSIRNGIGALMSADTGFTSYFTVDITNSNYILLTGIGSAHYGYYWPSFAERFNLNNGFNFLTYRPDGLSSDINYTMLQSWAPNSFSTGATSLNIITKDLFSQSSGQRKKVYKVYVTYRSGDCDDTNIKVEFITDGKDIDDPANSSNVKTFAAGTNYSIYSSNVSPTLNKVSGSEKDWLVAELKPSTSNDTKNIKSLRLKFSGETVSGDFAINDISVVYRVKNVK